MASNLGKRIHQGDICQYFNQLGSCKMGIKCRNKHGESVLFLQKNINEIGYHAGSDFESKRKHAVELVSNYSVSLKRISAFFIRSSYPQEEILEPSQIDFDYVKSILQFPQKSTLFPYFKEPTFPLLLVEKQMQVKLNAPTPIPIISALLLENVQLSSDLYNFISFRNNIKKIFLQSSWCIYIQRVGSTFIFRHCQFPSSNYGQIGRLFESECVEPSSFSPGKDFCVVTKSKIGNFNIFMGAEIDACNKVESENTHELGDIELVEIKTSKVGASGLCFSPEEKKNAWVQTYLAGVKNIIVGVDNSPIKGNGEFIRLDRYSCSDFYLEEECSDLFQRAENVLEFIVSNEKVIQDSSSFVSVYTLSLDNSILSLSEVNNMHSFLDKKTIKMLQALIN